MTIVDIEYDHQTQYKKFDNVTFSDIVTNSIDIENIMVKFQTKKFGKKYISVIPH